MSGLESRAPGLVGAALNTSGVTTGLIADGVHVHPTSIGIALRAHQGTAFLVSDAMSVAGTNLAEFSLTGQRVFRHDGRLVLADGTLAGADLDLLTAARNLVTWGHASRETALAMATRIPAELIGRAPLGTLAAGVTADVLHVSDDLGTLYNVWRAGRRIQ